MTTEQKADELIEKFTNQLNDMRASEWRRKHNAKACAIICVEEILNHMKEDDKYNGDCHNANSKWVQYYHEVLEILKSKT